MAFVGDENVVVVTSVPVPDVNVTDGPVRNAFTRGSAVSVLPARLVKFAAILVATRVWPALVELAVVVVGVVVVGDVVCAQATGANASSTALARIRISSFISSFLRSGSPYEFFRLQDDFRG